MMIKKFKIRILSLGCLVPVLFFTACSDSEQETDGESVQPSETAKEEKVSGSLTVGDTAPDFELTDQNGATVTLSDYKGKNIVLAFSRAHW